MSYRRSALAAGLVLLHAVVLAAPAHAATALRFAHPWPASAAINQQVFEVWADEIEQASDGRLEVQIFPSETLSKADATYQNAVNGISDIAATAQGYTPGRFPLTQVIELPGLSHSAKQGSCMAQKMYERGGPIADEYADSHVLFLFTTGQGFLNTRETSIRKPEDLAGLRIRRPSAVVGEMLSSVGAQSVGMPAPEGYTALQRGVIDGTTMPWEGMKTFRLNELTAHHTVMPLYTLTFVATMSKRTYERLPADLKQVIDDHSGMEWARRVGNVFAAEDAAGRAQAKAAGDEIIDIPNLLDDPHWGPSLRKATNNHLDKLEARDLPARTVYRHVQQAAAACAADEAPA
jgi:TRAP-type C4-dicarboxylate transport system substrate-binding protein